MKNQITALGIYCGIGSMLIGAKKAGFKVVGNYETRKGMNTGTFEKNFKAPFFNIDSILPFADSPDLIMGHPPCGNFSNLTNSAKRSIRDIKAKRKNPGLIENFVEKIKEHKPRYFVMENLPKSIDAYPPFLWKEELGKKYKIIFEKVDNYFYGNSQKHKKRLFVIGSLRKENFNFEQANNPFPETSVKEAIEDLPFRKNIPELNHVHFKPKDISPLTWGKDKKKTYKEISKILLKIPPGKAPSYIAKDGKEKKKIGMVRLYWDKHSHTLTGGSWGRGANKFHPATGYPLTAREMLRIQGAPDTFKLVLENEEDYLLQCGKFIAVEFCIFVAKQIMQNILMKERFDPKGGN